MKRSALLLHVLAAVLFFHCGCDSKTDSVTKGREAVKEVVTQPFSVLDSTKDSLSRSEDKTKAAVEELDKATQQP